MVLGQVPLADIVAKCTEFSIGQSVIPQNLSDSRPRNQQRVRGITGLDVLSPTLFNGHCGRPRRPAKGQSRAQANDACYIYCDIRLPQRIAARPLLLAEASNMESSWPECIAVVVL